MSMIPPDIYAQELKERLDKKEKLILIDVREVYENQQFNLGGQLIPMGELVSKIPRLLELKEKEIIVYCHSGNRSGWAKDFMLQHGFLNVRNLLGGVVDWIEKFGVSK